MGVAAALAEAEPTTNVQLLTHDTRPAAKARAIGLRFAFVPEEWIREPEQDELQRENQRLQEENRRLKAASPELTLSADGALDKARSSGDYYFKQRWKPQTICTFVSPAAIWLI